MKLGTKLECHSCGAKFYDFDKPEPICPKCGTAQEPKEVPEPAAPPKSEEEPKTAAAPVDDDEDGEELDDLDVPEDESE